MSNKNISLINIPNSPWIYKFLNKKWEIIYIWKSVNLKSRVSSYFNWKSKLNFAKQKMVDLIYNIETIVTNNETESLILETTLIKKYLPKYNILMKDGKNHLYIKITNEDFPKIIKTRIKNNNWTYFWPYISTFYVTNILKIIKSIFGYWIWEHNFFKSKNSYTLDKYIFKNNFKIEEYHNIINNIKKFLNWETKEIKRILEEKMKEKAKNLQFEEAQKIKEKLNSISILEENQIVREWVNGDYNIINYIEKFEKTYVWIIEIRDGKIVWFYNYDIENRLNENIFSLIKYVVENKWSNELKQKIIYILPLNIEKINKEINIEIPQIWTKKELLELCYRNIYEYAYKSHIDSLSIKWFTKKTMQNILDLLWYKKINQNIIFECNDISHISWNYTVASRSIIENWKSNTSKYKKFKIKSLSQWKIDDFNSMREVMNRRILEINKNNTIPDLIIIDGWKWQLSSVLEVINNFLKKISIEKKENNLLELLKKVQIVWLAKREEELFLPWKKDPILLKKDSLELRLIQKIRDEAHRFAITFNRDSRIKAMKKNILEELPGFWPKTRKKILNKYWNIEKLKEINKNELNDILNRTQIKTLENHWLIN